LKSTTLNINNEPEHNVLNYLEYHETGLPGIKHLHGSSQNSMYSWQHSYNPRGWLTALNSNTTAQLFNLELFYDELPAEADDYASEQYNGNISAMHWSTQGIDDKMGAYAFEYDNLNRLTDATYYYKDASNNLHYCLSGGSNPGLKRAIIGIGSVFDIGYDKNGNIDSLTRIGRQQSGWLTFDKLTYAYDANRLKAVDDEISGQNNLGDFHDNGYKYHQLGQAEYLYDHNGNMTSDINRSLTLEYALGTNLPERIIHPGGHIRNYYTPAGRKTGKKVFDASNNLLSQELYYGDLIIKDGRATRILHGDGVVNLSGGSPQFDYHIKDHLGNVRLVITPESSNNPVVLQANDYYPFGMSYSTAPGVNKYLYNSKEEQEMPGKFLDYGWRMYDAQLGRFHSVDPMAAEFPFQSPYLYALNNPIRFIDFMGMSAEEPDKEDEEEERRMKEELARLQAQQAAIQAQIDALNKAVFQYKLRGGQVTKDDDLAELQAAQEGRTESVSVVGTLIDVFIREPIQNGLEYLGMGENAAYWTSTGITVVGSIVLAKKISGSKEGIKYPGNDPTKAPKGYQWKGRPASTPGTKQGNYVNTKTNETLRPDLNHPAPIKPHWDYTDPSGKQWRIFQDGSKVPK
jgi:RHS repeat-associated protein